MAAGLPELRSVPTIRDFRAHSIRCVRVRRPVERIASRRRPRHDREQPTQVLRLLLERHGELVTREDLRAALWPDQTFIDDFDQGLNAAVNGSGTSCATRRRSAIHRDRPAAGYRFIGHVDEPEAVQGPPISSSSEPGHGDGHDRERSGLGGFTALVMLASVFAVKWMALRSTSPPAAPATLPPRVVALTTLPGVESFADTLSGWQRDRVHMERREGRQLRCLCQGRRLLRGSAADAGFGAGM